MAIENYFNKVLSLKKIPPQKLVRLTTTRGDSIVKTPSGREVPLIYEDALSIKARSTFDGIGNPKSNTLMTILSSTTNGIIPSGQYALQNIQIWKSTEPLELSLSVKLEMLDSGYNDVVYPTQQLMKLCLPEIRNSGLSQKLGALIPPGPSLKEILTLSKSESQEDTDDILALENSLVNVSIGKFHFNNCIVTDVSPEFSSTLDEDDYPIEAQISLDIKTCMIATREMVDSIVSK